MKTIKLKKSDVGRAVRVLFDDTGASDGIITEVRGPTDFKYLEFGGHNPDNGNNGAPVIKLGKKIAAVDVGLD